MNRLSTILVAALIFFPAAATNGFAQENGDASSESSAPATVLDSATRPSDGVKTDERNILVGLTPAGVQRQVAGRWATLAVNGTNNSDEDSTETSLVMIGDRTDLQFGRKVWLPAGARRQAWMPIHIPADLTMDQLQVAMTWMHLKESGGQESFQASAIGTPTVKRSLLLSWEESRAAAVLDSLTPDLDEVDRAAVLARTVYAGRDAVVASSQSEDEAGGQDLGMAQLTGHFLPPTANPLDSLDQIVIANDRILNDTVGVMRLRSWLHSGGRVWIMVDQLTPSSVRALLGDAICYSIVDRVELTDYELEQVARHASADAISETWSSETPVELVRVMIDSTDIDIRVDGWPAAFWTQVGEGEVLFTTLGAAGWLKDEEPTDALRMLSSRFFEPRIESPRHDRELSTFLSREIGYRVPGRRLVAILLGAHFLVLLAAGIWLAKRRELHYLAAIIPITALVSAGILAVVGKRHTDAVPSTIATGQIVRAGNDSSEVRVESVAAIYSQNARELPITSSPDAVTVLGDQAPTGETRRILWDDSGDSRWLFVEQPPSKVQHVETTSTVTLPTAWSARGRFTPNGFEGELSGLPDGRSEDAVIVSATGPALALRPRESEDAFSANESDVLLPNQYVDARLMSDVQQDRQELIRELRERDPGLFPNSPAILFWTSPIDAGVAFPEDFSRRGWALASIPVRLSRLATGSEFSVPASFVRIESYLGRRGPSTVFNPKTGRWLTEMNRPNETDLRCVLPREVTPCDFTAVNLVMKITAPGRTLRIKAIKDGQVNSLHETESPAGRLEYAIDPADLQVDDRGGFLISIEVSPTEVELQQQSAPPPGLAVEGGTPGTGRRLSDESRSKWAIDYLHFHVKGVTQ